MAIYICLGFRGEFQAQDIHLRVTGIQMMFQAMSPGGKREGYEGCFLEDAKMSELRRWERTRRT